MSDIDLHAKIAQLQQLFSRRMRVGGTLAQQVKRRQRRLPHKLRADAKAIVAAMPMLDHPHLSRQVDEGAIAAATDRMISHLKQIDPRDRPWVKVVQALSWVMLAIVTVGLAYVLYLKYAAA